MQWEKLPRASFPLIDGQGPVFEPFAEIGLLATKNLDRIREAYRTQGLPMGSGQRPERGSGQEGFGSWTDEGRRWCCRRTNSSLSGTPFWHSGHCSGG